MEDSLFPYDSGLATAHALFDPADSYFDVELTAASTPYACWCEELDSVETGSCVAEGMVSYGRGGDCRHEDDRRPSYWKETNHRQNRRMKNFDYKGKHVYLVTFKRTVALPPLSVIRGDLTRVGERIYAEPTEYGQILLDVLAGFEKRNPMIRNNFMVIMPDHVHIIFQVVEVLERVFGWYIGQMEGACTKLLRNRYPHYAKTETTYFIPRSWNDKVLGYEGQWRGWQYYIADNPRRRLARQMFPKLYQRNMILSEEREVFHGYGNIFLLDIPGKVVVRYTSKLSEAANNANFERVRALASEGFVIVSPFIHPKERSLYHEGMREGWKIIRIVELGFLARSNPHKTEFNYCGTGNYLLLSMRGERGIERKHVSRDLCLEMNKFAERVASGNLRLRHIHLE